MKPVTRRAALSSTLIVPAATAFSYQANSKVNFGIIGTGGRGRYVGKLMTQDKNAQLVAICDIYPDRIDLAKTQLPGADKVPVYKDLNELLARKDVDAVLIATPVFLHPPHFEAAAKAGKHIYCEKPAGASVAGVLRLQKAAQAMDQSKSVVFGFQQRFSPEYLEAYKTLKNPEQFGDLNLMISYWVWGGSAFSPGRPVLPDPEEEKIRNWGRYKETSGDFIVEQDCHGLDILNWFAGAHPLSAIGGGGRYKRSTGTNTDHALVAFTYPGGLPGWLLGSQLPPSGYWDVKEQFIGTKGSLDVTRYDYSYTPAGKKEPTLTQKSKREITNEATEAWFASILAGKPIHMAQDACTSTLTSLLGGMACEKQHPVTWEEMLASA